MDGKKKLTRWWSKFCHTFTSVALFIIAVLAFHTFTPESLVKSAMANVSTELKEQAKATHDQVAAQPLADTVYIATQLGRLDMISLSLTALGVALAIGGIFGLMNFRNVAREAAHQAALETTEENVLRLLQKDSIKDLFKINIEEIVDASVDQKIEETLKVKATTYNKEERSEPDPLDSGEGWDEEDDNDKKC